VLKQNIAIALENLVEHNPGVRPAHQFCQFALALLDWGTQEGLRRAEWGFYASRAAKSKSLWPGECDEKIQDRWENRRHIFVALSAPLCG
jgi:hypothetical protein